MGQKVILDIEDLTALADEVRENLGETDTYSLDELTDTVARASALPVDGTEGQVVAMGADGKPKWISGVPIVDVIDETNNGDIISVVDGKWAVTEVASDDDAFDMLCELGVAEYVTDENGNVLTDENGNILAV